MEKKRIQEFKKELEIFEIRKENEADRSLNSGHAK